MWDKASRLPAFFGSLPAVLPAKAGADEKSAHKPVNGPV